MDRLNLPLTAMLQSDLWIALQSRCPTADTAACRAAFLHWALFPLALRQSLLGSMDDQNRSVLPSVATHHQGGAKFSQASLDWVDSKHIDIPSGNEIMREKIAASTREAAEIS